MQQRNVCTGISLTHSPGCARRHVHELNHVEAGLVLGGLTAANGGFNPGPELMDALFDAVIKEQVSHCTTGSSLPHTS